MTPPAPPPPPYTPEQVIAITSPRERKRAHAEIASYVARLKKEREERETALSGGYSAAPSFRSNSGVFTGSAIANYNGGTLANYNGGAPVNSLTPYRPAPTLRSTSGGFNGTAFANYNSSAPASHPAPYRSGPSFRSTSGGFNGTAPANYSPSYRSAPGCGGYGYRGRYSSYHPYQRPASSRQFKNRSVTFGGTNHATQDPEGDENKSGNTSASTGRQQTEPKTLCPALTSTGVCSRPGCYHLHDPNKQALCKHWLYKTCTKGELCSLSHEPSPHNAPTCLHFQDGRCTNDDCRFAHVRINPSAVNCEAFGRLGYCEKGDTCSELHAHECPTFANTGVCRFGDKCRLGHVLRAARMRKAARLSSSAPSPLSNTTDSPDTPEVDMDTAEDTQECVIPKSEPDEKPHLFTQQADFVPFDTVEADE